MLRQGDDGFQPVVFDDPAPDFRLTAARVAGEEGRAVEDDGDSAAAVFGRTHLGEHVLQEQQRAVVDARRARSEPALITQLVVLVLDVFLLLLPLHAEGRIGEHVIELFFGESVPGERVREDDVVRILTLDEHVGLADSPRLVVPVLAEQQRVAVSSLGVSARRWNWQR